MSNRITKQIAETVAIQLCAAKKEEIKALNEQLSSVVTDHFEKTVPADIISLFRKKPKWFSTRSYVYVDGVGLDHRSYNLTEEIPCADKNRVKVSDEDAAFILTLTDAIEDKQNEYRTLVKSIEVTLINLRTYNNVEKVFPEAFAILPFKQNSAVAINLQDIRCKLDAANCQETKELSTH